MAAEPPLRQNLLHMISLLQIQQLVLLVDERCNFHPLFKNFDEKLAFHKNDFSVALSRIIKDLGPYTERVDL